MSPAHRQFRLSDRCTQIGEEPNYSIYRGDVIVAPAQHGMEPARPPDFDSVPAARLICNVGQMNHELDSIVRSRLILSS